MADTSVLREYLILLGIDLDEEGGKKLTQNLEGWDKQAKSLALGLIGISTAATTAVGVFAYQMEKLYFSSKLAQSSAGNIQALSYGAGRIGIQNMQQTIEGVARIIRGNPGVNGLLHLLGVKTGKDTSETTNALLDRLSEIATQDGTYARANAYGRIFGIDEDTIYRWKIMRKEAMDAMQEQRQVAAQMGANVDQAALAGHHVTNAFAKARYAATLFLEMIADKLSPQIDEMGEGLNLWFAQMLRGLDNIKIALSDGDAWMKIQNADVRTMAGLVHNIREEWKAINADNNQGGLTHVDIDHAKRTPEGKLSGEDYYMGTNLGTGEPTIYKKRWLDKMFERFMKWGGAKKYQHQPDPDIDLPWKHPDEWVPNEQGGYTYVTQGQRDTSVMGNVRASHTPHREDVTPEQAAPAFAQLEKRYQLPAGLLDKIWEAETRRGKGSLLSPMGAEGPFQFMPETAKRFNLQDPYSFQQSSEAAAKYLHDLLERYHGDLKTAVGAYNLGEGGMDDYKLGKRTLPEETRKYEDRVMGGMTQNNNITVNGSSDPKKAAEEVAEQQRIVNADFFRNNTPRLH